MRVVFHPAIERDVRDIVAYYDGCSAGLGGRFRATFYRTVDELIVFPEKFARKFDAIRTKLIRPFPYLVFYSIENDMIFVLSVQYAGREPGHLRSVARGRKGK